MRDLCRHLRHGIGLLLVLLCGAAQAGALSVTLATAGPGNLSHLPVELIKEIGADAAEGVDLTVRYFGGGPLAYKDLLAGNSDFAVAGAPALAGLAVKGEPVVSLAAVNRVPTFVLMVRRDLKGKVKGVADLKGRVIGVNTASAATKSTSQQVAEFILRRAGVDPDRQVNFVPAGQSLEEQQAALDSGAVDALMGDEPFASRLEADGRVFILLDLHDPEASRRALGGLFLNAQLATRRDILQKQPDKAARMVRVLARTLRWIATHPAEDIVAALAPADDRQRRVLLTTLRRHKAVYSPDGAFTEEQIRTAEAFFRANQPPDSPGAQFDFMNMIEPRHAGLKPR